VDNGLPLFLMPAQRIDIRRSKDVRRSLRMRPRWFGR
jgi:hypothetical protein